MQRHLRSVLLAVFALIQFVSATAAAQQASRDGGVPPPQRAQDERLPGPGDPRVITRGGVFATRDAVLRPGYRVASAREADFERDGQPDALLVIDTDGRATGGGDGAPYGGVVYARHTAQGWSAPYEAQNDDRNRNRWGPALQLGTRAIFTLINETNVEGGESGRMYGFFGVDAAGAWRAIGGATNGDDMQLAAGAHETWQIFGAGPARLELVCGREHRFMALDWRSWHFSFRREPWRADDGGAAAQRVAPVPTTASLAQGYCMAWTLSDVHLRPTPTVESTGTPLRAGAALRVSAATDLRRGEARLYRVQVQPQTGPLGATGYTFLLPYELDPACPWP